MTRLHVAVALLAACTTGGEPTTADSPATDTADDTSTATPTTSASATTTGPTTPPGPGRWRGMLHVNPGWNDNFEDCETGEFWPVRNLPSPGYCENELLIEIEGILEIDAPDVPGTSLFVTAVLAGPCVEGSCDEPWSACHDFDVACMQLPDCDPFAQDCPEGQKCSPYDSGFGSDAWDNTRCVPIAPNPKPPGEPCSAPEGPTAGIDDCAEGSFCWKVDKNTLIGTCVAQCVGSYGTPSCDDPTLQCAITNHNALTVCLPPCDPVEPVCPPDDACLPLMIDDSQFVCVPDASGDEGQTFDPCEMVNGCDPGLLCANAALADECDANAASGCCLPFCDLDTWQCPGAGQECLPWFQEDAPAGLEDLGVCGSPSDRRSPADRQ